MFTGIVQAVGRVLSCDATPTGRRLVVDPGTPIPLRPGDSLCVSGVCLTLVGRDEGTKGRRDEGTQGRRDEGEATGSESSSLRPCVPLSLAFDVVTETLDRTTLGQLTPGSPVNLEPAVTPSQPLGGHFMQGHVDGVAEVVDVQRDPAHWRLTLRPPGDLMRYMIPKGGLAVDGVSLTLAAVHPDTLDLALIPTTLERTTLGELQPGNRVNLEADILVKTVITTLERQTLPTAPPTPPPKLRRDAATPHRGGVRYGGRGRP